MEAESGSPVSAGFLGSLRTLGAGLLDSVHDRLELLSVELHEEKIRLLLSLLWLGAAVFAGVMAVTFGSLTLVYLFWESARIAVLGGLTLVYSVALVALVFAFRRHLARQPQPFAATLQELKEDSACIRPDA